jgi:G:T-mismatch repair DNA endonuclease (very short patch repair protein)
MCGSCFRDTDNNSSEIHYSIEVPKTKTDYWFSKYNRVLHHYSVSIAATAVVVAVVVMVAAAC